jgi:hypothetical protein
LNPTWQSWVGRVHQDCEHVTKLETGRQFAAWIKVTLLIQSDRREWMEGVFVENSIFELTCRVILECRIGMVMFSLGNGKQTFLDDGTTLPVSEPSDLLRLLRAQQQLLEKAMNKEDMTLYETRAQQISELLQQLSNG